MNAAAKVMHQSNIFEGHMGQLRLTQTFFWMVVLSFSVLLSAFSVIYSTNAYRSTLHQVESLHRKAHQAELQRGQLLLEWASINRPSRIEKMAETHLGMTYPDKSRQYLNQTE